MFVQVLTMKERFFVQIGYFPWSMAGDESIAYCVGCRSYGPKLFKSRIKYQALEYAHCERCNAVYYDIKQIIMINNNVMLAIAIVDFFEDENISND